MGLIDRLRQRSRSDGVPAAPQAVPPTTTTISARRLPAGSLLGIVGESHYQQAIIAAHTKAQGTSVPLEWLEGFALDVATDEPDLCWFEVWLCPEPDNPYDSNAIAVWSLQDGELGERLGYLSREDAAEYRPVFAVLRELGFNGAVVPAFARFGGPANQLGAVVIALSRADFCMRALEGERQQALDRLNYKPAQLPELAATDEEVATEPLAYDTGMLSHDDPERVAPTILGGNETLEVVGESHRQDVLWRIVGGRRSGAVRHDVCAILQPEPTNPHDTNAVMVLIEDELVGYLSRDDAALYGPGLARLMNQTHTPIGLLGVIVGGGERVDGRGFLGVFLDHDPTDFGVTRQRAADIPGFRTGFSEAVASDLEDDSYDLSWYARLSPDVITAIKQLRSWLETEPDPIDRHYMMNELEERLYKSRDAFESALEAFDAVCRQHDAEMSTIRPALLEKFGRIPVLDTYRQAAIRCQKARDWATMRHWAERGLSVYGEHAGRQDVVADLEKRLAYASAKLEAATSPRRVKAARADTGMVVRSPVLEILVCTSCGQSFERERTRGRKPQMCPNCRGVAADE